MGLAYYIYVPTRVELECERERRKIHRERLLEEAGIRTEVYKPR